MSDGPRSIRTLTMLNGEQIETRSKLESDWVEAFSTCDIHCYECRKLRVVQTGKFGQFFGTYTPDLVLFDGTGHEIFVELKPDHDQCVGDDRQRRALAVASFEMDYRFLVIGGYPYAHQGVTLRMISHAGELMRQNVTVEQLLELLGCTT